MTKLGKYEVIAELAAGSMGVLYRARDTILDREVALKTIAGTGSLDPGTALRTRSAPVHRATPIPGRPQEDQHHGGRL